MRSIQASEAKQAELQQCLERVAKQRDKQAFSVLFDHYGPLIRAYSLAREPGADLLADDLTQEVMIKLWQKAHTYKPQLSKLNTWIYTLARNARIDHLRRHGRYACDIDPTEVFATIEDAGPGPFQAAQQQRLEDSVYRGIKQLPREQADVLAKVYLEGKSHQQTSEELKLPLGTIKSRIRLALKKLELLVRR